MKFFATALAFFALASTAYARPPACTCTADTNDSSPKVTHYATWDCKFNTHLLWDTYTLSGTSWPDEKEIKRACGKAGIVSKWKYELSHTEDEKLAFKATFRLPVAAQEYLSKHLNGLLEIDQKESRALECTQS